MQTLVSVIPTSDEITICLFVRYTEARKEQLHHIYSYY